MNMTAERNIFTALWVCLLCVCLSGCGEKYSENALLLKKAFEYLNADDADNLLSLAGDVGNTLGLGTEKKLPGYIWATDIVIRVDTAYPDRIFYSCVIPGATTVTINNVLGIHKKELSPMLSKNLKVKGEIPIRTDPQTGKKYMDISDASDPFSLYLRIVYNPKTSVDRNSLKTNEDVAMVMTQVALVVGGAYEPASSNKDYFSRVFLPELAALFEESSDKLEKYTNACVKLNELEEALKVIGRSTEKEEIITIHEERIAKPVNYRLIAEIAGCLLIIVLPILFVCSCIWAGWKSSFAKRLIWKISAGNIRLKAIKKMTDAIMLKEVALKDSKWKVREAAVLKITDANILKKVALKDSIWKVRLAAIEKITDEAVLKEVALKDSDKDVRLAAVKKITDEAVLKEVALKDSEKGVRLAAVKKITDEAVLKEVALKDSDKDVRLAAVEKITDEAVLKEVALKDSDKDVRLAAVEKITDAAVLKEIVLTASDSAVRLKAVKKITDEAVLKKVALKDLNSNVRWEAVKKITDEAVLKKVALKDSDSDVRQEAVKKITDEVVLKEVALKDSDKGVCLEAVKKITDEAVLKKVALKNPNKYVRLEAVKKITDEAVLEEVTLKDSDSDVRWEAKRTIERLQLMLREHVQIFLSPEEENLFGHTRRHYLSVMFCNQTETDSHVWKKTAAAFGSKHVTHEAYEATRSGWSLAALGRLISWDCTPERFKASLAQFETVVLPRYNQQLDVYEIARKALLQIHEELKQMETPSMLDDLEEILRKYRIRDEERIVSEFQEKQKEFEREALKIERLMLEEADKANILPFAFFMQVINDTQGRFDRFIRQGAIMGMIDFFMKYRDHEIIKPYFENLIAARNSMIASDDQMSFFEVRVPMNCTAKEYAVILKEVLHCANPTLRYCDTEKLMEIAEAEIPGIMDLLVHYPLRLIDPGNETTEGFYTFEPYRHAMWVRYTPPQDVGQVQKRYHEVLDMTLPNSSGLNVRLFSDPYLAVPVMFHEYNHYLEDPNEASVFLKTYVFSLKFYRKYPDADPAKDLTFMHLNRLLGNAPDAEKMNLLNDLILKYYGAPKSKKEAIAEADADLMRKNMYIEYNNQQQTWCPEVRMPLLNDAGDKENADLIRNIRIRHAQVPRTITQRIFNRLWTEYMPISRSLYEEYRKLVPAMFWTLKEKEMDGKTVKCFTDWESFKDWCVDRGYIKRYNR